MRRGWGVLVAVASLVACRGIVGIEDLSVSRDGGTVADSGARDASADTGASVDAGSDAGADAGSCRQSEQGLCIKCCREKAAQVGNQKFDKALADACMCLGPAQCATDCANDLCKALPPLQTCLNCITPRTVTCSAGLSTCKTDPDCAPIATCIEADCQ